MSRKFECISCLFPWELEQDSEYDFCRLCCVLDIMTIIFKYDGELTCGIRPGVPTGKEIYKKITAYNNGLNSERFPRDKKGRITLDKIEKGLDWRIKLFGLHQDENVEKCPCCGCVNGVLKKCGRCRIVYYCSKMCQSIHWKIHQRNCVESCEKILEKKK